MATAAEILAMMQDEKAINDILNSAALKDMLGAAQTNVKTQTDPLALAKALGLVYSLEDLTQQAVDAASAGNAVRDAQYRNAINAYYQGLGAQSAGVMDALRRAQAASSISGATAGTAAANTLSALLAQTQNSSGDALTLAQQGIELGKQNAADLATARNTALAAYNKLGTDLYGLMNDANAVTAQNIASYAGLGQAALGAQSAANDRISNINLHGNEMLNNEAIARLAADAQKAAARATADATRYAADQERDWQRYASYNNLLAANAAYGPPAPPSAAVQNTPGKAASAPKASTVQGPPAPSGSQTIASNAATVFGNHGFVTGALNGLAGSTTKLPSGLNTTPTSPSSLTDIELQGLEAARIKHNLPRNPAIEKEMKARGLLK